MKKSETQSEPITAPQAMSAEREKEIRVWINDQRGPYSADKVLMQSLARELFAVIDRLRAERSTITPELVAAFGQPRRFYIGDLGVGGPRRAGEIPTPVYVEWRGKAWVWPGGREKRGVVQVFVNDAWAVSINAGSTTFATLAEAVAAARKECKP